MERMGDLLHQEFGALAPARIRRKGEAQANQLQLARRPRTRGEMTWVCVAGEEGTYWNLKLTYKGCGVVPPLEIRPGHFVRQSCQCEKARLAAHKEATAKAERDREEIYKTFQCWGGASLAHYTFDTFIRARQPLAYDVALAYAQAPAGTLILHGEQFGVGKTHLLAAICNALRERGISSTFVTSPDFFNVVQGRFANREGIQPILNRARTSPLFVFDDTDKSTPAPWKQEIYFEIIDERTKQGLPTAISINKLGTLADHMGGAVASRLKIGQVAIELTGADYRPNL